MICLVITLQFVNKKTVENQKGRKTYITANTGHELINVGKTVTFFFAILRFENLLKKFACFFLCFCGILFCAVFERCVLLFLASIQNKFYCFCCLFVICLLILKVKLICSTKKLNHKLMTK